MAGPRLGVGAALLFACLLGGCASPEQPLRLTWGADEAELRVIVQLPDAAPFRLLVIPNGTQSIEVRLANGTPQTVPLLTTDRIAVYDTSVAPGAVTFGKLRPGNYVVGGAAYSAPGGSTGGGVLMANRSSAQALVGGATTTVTLKLRIVPLGGKVLL